MDTNYKMISSLLLAGVSTWNCPATYAKPDGAGEGKAQYSCHCL